MMPNRNVTERVVILHSRDSKSKLSYAFIHYIYFLYCLIVFILSSAIDEISLFAKTYNTTKSQYQYPY